MANPIPKPILGSFETIGENIVSQLKQIPKDVGQVALETVGLGTASGGGKKTQKTQMPGKTQDLDSSWQQMDQIQDEQTKKTIARKALEELLTPTPSVKEPTEYEKRMQEEEQKKKMEEEERRQQSQALPAPTGKKKQGMYGIKAKQQGSEIGKNVKHD